MTLYRFMSLNILTDGLYNYGDSRFHLRAEAINEMIRATKPDVIGVQELTDAMKPYLFDILKKYQLCGESRGSLFNDEYSAVLFRNDRFRLLDSDTYWLSKTPGRKSKHLLSQFPRITTYVHLYDEENQKDFTFFNTHLDHNLKPVRNAQAEILSSLIKEHAEGEFIAVTGDFNAPISALPPVLLEENHLKDTVDPAIGSTLRGKIGSLIQKNLPIDHILISEHMNLNSLEKLDSKYAGYYPSDHFPLLAVVSD
ncbi:MAG: endonuclease/exonuclease/phosphatase family protein [Erysipelotrichaceae bacterium]|nr:endonuclease/exonuclease/phosphatase family protein [Erysipelotrichaceae bacterium]